MILAQPCVQFWSPVSKKINSETKTELRYWRGQLSTEPPTGQETVPSCLLQGKAAEEAHDAPKNI